MDHATYHLSNRELFRNNLSPVVPREPQDYCAGRGGKTWFLATLVAPNGTVCAWDIEEDLRKQLEGARAKRTLGELVLNFVGVEGSGRQGLC